MLQRLLARLGLSIERARSPQTLAAATLRHHASLGSARSGLEALAREESAVAEPERAVLRRERIALEAAAERLRMRVELFRSEKLAIGARVVDVSARSRAGDTPASLAVESGALAKAVEDLRARVRALARSDS